MALAAELTQVHRQLQLSLRAATVKDVAAVWPAFDVTNPASWPAVETALLAIVRDRGNTSAGLALQYYQEFRAAEQIAGAATPTIADPVIDAQVRTSLKVTGLVSTTRAVKAHRRDATAIGLVTVSGSVSRYVLDQGRDSILNSIAADQQALGWARVTSTHPCSFCALLAARGPVYSSEESADFRAHDHCSCSVEPTYSRHAPWPGQAKQYRSLYDEVTKGLSGASARNAFRRAFSAR